MSFDIDASSAQAAFTDLERIVDRIEEAAGDTARAQADRLLDQVSGRVPYLTGRLASSLGLFTVEGAERGAEVGYDTSAPYAGWIEFGGSRGRPHISEGRYLYPAAANAEQTVVAALEETASREIDRYPWSGP